LKGSRERHRAWIRGKRREKREGKVFFGAKAIFSFYFSIVGHFTLNFVYGDGRCSGCDGRAATWGDRFYLYHQQSLLDVKPSLRIVFFSSFFLSFSLFSFLSLGT